MVCQGCRGGVACSPISGDDGFASHAAPPIKHLCCRIPLRVEALASLAGIGFFGVIQGFKVNDLETLQFIQPRNYKPYEISNKPGSGTATLKP